MICWVGNLAGLQAAVHCNCVTFSPRNRNTRHSSRIIVFSKSNRQQAPEVAGTREVCNIDMGFECQLAYPVTIPLYHQSSKASSPTLRDHELVGQAGNFVQTHAAIVTCAYVYTSVSKSSCHCSPSCPHIKLLPLVWCHAFLGVSQSVNVADSHLHLHRHNYACFAHHIPIHQPVAVRSGGTAATLGGASPN